MSVPRQLERATDEGTHACVSGLLAADRARDAAAYGGWLHGSFVLRLEGEIVALGPDAAVAYETARWERGNGQVVDVLAVDVVPPNAYVRFVMRDASHRAATVGYSVYEIEGRRALVASHFFRELVPEPVSAFATAVEPPATDPRLAAPPAARRRRWAMPLAALASWVAQDALLATPVVAAAARYGALPAFSVLTTVYFCASLTISMLALHMLGRRPEDRPPRLTAWLERRAGHGRSLRAMRAGRSTVVVLGFVLGSYLMSSAPTMWALHELGVRRRLSLLAIISSAIWAAGFVGFYAGAAKLLGL